MKINWQEEDKKHNLLAWAIIECMSAKAGSQGFSNVFPEFNGDCLDVEFKVNGVDLPVKRAFELIEAQMDRMIAKKAEEILRDKFVDMADLFTEFSDVEERELKEIAKSRIHKDMFNEDRF